MSEAHETEKKRKRRSFWEPESDKVVEWLDAQTDLGTSLQLIIVDAIRQYGKGDVIKAHLTQRERMYQDEPQPLAERPLRPNVQVFPPEPSEPDTADVRAESTEAAEPVLPPVLAPEAAEESENDDQDMELDFEPKWTPENESAEEPPFDIQDMIPNAEAKGEESDYDPIAIMMGDIGSTLNK